MAEQSDRAGSSAQEPESGGSFERLEHTADEGIRAYGRSLPEIFAAAARGMFSVIADVDSVRPEQARRIELRAESAEELLHDWLEELNGLHQVSGELYSAFEVEIDAGGRHLQATVRGEPMDPARHSLAIEVKAVTWHGFHLEETADGLAATVLFDV